MRKDRPAPAPLLEPLSYPGRPVTAPSLLLGGGLLPLYVRGTRLGDWYVEEETRQQSLDDALCDLGGAVTGRRTPVIAVGSNASPEQVRYKLTRLGVRSILPMVPVLVRGVRVGCSGHISPAGYVARTPYADRDAATVLVVSWLDSAQLEAIDSTELANFRRAMLPGDVFEMTMPSGERLDGAYLYVSAHGVLLDPDGMPRPCDGDQSALLAALLGASPRLRELLGPDPAAWVRKARADRAVREAGTQIFGDEGWVRPLTDFVPWTTRSPRNHSVTAWPEPSRSGYPPSSYGGVRPEGLCPDDPKADGAAE
ncbi:hypothetical protein FBY35_2233 [Streptomyces sp. SLBN-118]|uniref:hypothetical protein n=1 Tax=Streptomyces sp. SLBN-118 TaxID=2768454 RepID=UPI001169B939|nr:hypothetical protein [Streptomyces sp. SLBN-118]TQK51813.1 hypothetical protein FBY35_2233 [Streptomyces sp. SLBN-118]